MRLPASFDEMDIATIVADLIDADGTFTVKDEPDQIRDIAHFTITAATGEVFSVAINPKRGQP